MLTSSAEGYIFFMVLRGIRMRRSSSPIPKPPLGFSTTPMTRKSAPSIMTSLPTGCPSGKSTGATFSPSITTFSLCRSSPSLMKRPSSVEALAYTWPKFGCTPRKSMACTSPALVRTEWVCIQGGIRNAVTFLTAVQLSRMARWSSRTRGFLKRSSRGGLPCIPWLHLEMNAVSTPYCLIFS